MNPAKIDIFHMVLNAGLMVQFVLLLLLFFSVTSWSIMIMKYRYIKRAIYESSEFIDFFWKSRNLSNAFSKAKMLQGSPVARIFRVGYVELKKSGKFQEPAESGSVNPSETQGGPSLGSSFTGIGNVKRALRRAINAETTRMTRMVPFLATTGNTTPFIGLFGTVWGIMNSFHGIGLRGSASLAVVAPGISEALIATAAGLAAAIPAVIAFNHFMQKIRTIESELQNFSADFLNIIERDIMT
jgi:biopolymer transport protein TolQ